MLWNGAHITKPLLSITEDELRQNMIANVVSPVLAAQAIQADLEAHKGAILVTGAGLGMDNPPGVQYAVKKNAGSLAVNKAVQRKVSAILHDEFEPKGVFVGEVAVCGLVKGTSFDDGTAKLMPDQVAEKFQKLLAERTNTFITIS